MTTRIVRGRATRALAVALVACAMLLVATPRSASADTATAPYGMIVLLQLQAPKASGTCTGFMIGPHTVATAGHCIYDPEVGGWMTSVLVTPGIDGLNAPFGTVRSTSFAVSPKWLQSQDVNADYAAITLDSDALGNATGWFDLVAPSSFSITSGKYAMAGYGTNVQYGTQWHMPQPLPLVDSTDNLIAYMWGTATGDSGAPIFDPLPAARYRVIGVHHGALVGGSSRLEYGPRVNTAMLDFYREQTGKPSAPAAQVSPPTIFTTAAGVPVRIAGPTTAANTPASLQSSRDQITWSTIGTATTDAKGASTFSVQALETSYYRVIVQGVGAGRVGRGLVTGGAGTRGTFATAPSYSSARIAFSVFQGGTAAQLDAALTSVGASAAWVQDARGAWLIYIVGGTFVNSDFTKAYPDGFEAATSMTLVGA